LGLLILVGLGLNLNDIPIGAIEAVSKCREAFLETYTSPTPSHRIEAMERIFRRSLRLLDRSEVEDGRAILEILPQGDVALLVPGDPLISTTHVSLRMEAARRGFCTKVVHASSILSTAIGESCLQATRFGRVATISFLPSVQPYDVLEQNLERGLHTLFLLDVDDEAGRAMTIGEAVRLLLQAEELQGRGVVSDQMLGIGLARLSLEDQVVRAGTLSQLMRAEFPPPPHSVVIPGKLHFAEREALEVLLGWKGQDAARKDI